MSGGVYEWRCFGAGAGFLVRPAPFGAKPVRASGLTAGQIRITPNISGIMLGVMSTHLVAAPPHPPAPSDHAARAENLAAAFLLGYSGDTRDAYRRDLSDWFRFLADLGVDPLAAQRLHVDAYARQLGEVEGRSPATVARRLSALSGYYAYVQGEDAIERNPVTRVRRPKVGTDTTSTGLDREELSALIRAG